MNVSTEQMTHNTNDEGAGPAPATAVAGPALGKSNGKEIFKPDGTEELLKGWLLHAHKGRQRHDLAARRCDQYRIWLGGLAAALSAIVGTSVFATFGKETSDITMHKVVVVIISLLSAILTSLGTFLNLSERAEKHRSAGVRYKEVIRELERILSVSVDGLTNSDVSLTRIQEKLDELEERAPVVAERIYDRVENEWQKVGIRLVEKAGDLYHPKGVRKAIMDRKIVLTDLVHAIREYRKLAEQKPLTLQGSDYAHAVEELNKVIDRAEGLL